MKIIQRNFFPLFWEYNQFENFFAVISNTHKNNKKLKDKASVPFIHRIFTNRT